MDTATDTTTKIRKRLTALNTKAYYLLVALAFLYTKNVALHFKFPLLPVAIALTVSAAVLPLQDYSQSERWLNRVRWFKFMLLNAAFIFTLLWLYFSAVAPAAAAQKPAPTQTAEQQRPQQSAGDFESRLRAAEEKADRANRAQQEAKDYYEKAFQTQVKFLDWFVVLVAATPLLIGLFGFRIIDRTIEHALSKASTDLEKNFDQKLAAELKTLKDSNAAQVKELEKALTERYEDAHEDLKTRSEFQFRLAVGLSTLGDKDYAVSRGLLRLVVKVYKSRKRGQLIDKGLAAVVLGKIFLTIKLESSDKFAERAKQELEDELYNDLRDELNEAAIKLTWLAPLVLGRKQVPAGAPKS